MDPRPYLLALLLGLCVMTDYSSLAARVQVDNAPRAERPKALVERFEKPRHA